VQDPFDTFQLPFELRELLPKTDQQTLREEILDIHVRLLKRDPELEDNRGRGAHLWLLFNAIASRLQSQQDFQEHVVPTLIPKLVDQIRSALSWYPSGDENLGYFLRPVIVRWQNSNANVEGTTDSGPTRRISGAPAANGPEEIQAEDGTPPKMARVPKERKTPKQVILEYKVRNKIRTHELVAEKLGLERSVYFDLKAGRKVGEETYVKAALVIGCSPDDLKP
jgi:hypothetical protein